MKKSRICFISLMVLIFVSAKAADTFGIYANYSILNLGNNLEIFGNEDTDVTFDPMFYLVFGIAI